MTKIFDTHSHYIPPEIAKNTAFFKVNWSNIEGQMEAMEKNGIEKSLLLYPTSDAHIQMNGWAKVAHTYNEGIAKVIHKYKGKFIGAGILPPDNMDAMIDELKKFQTYGFQAVSMASSYEGKYLDEGIFFPVYEFAQKKNFPIHVHPQIMNPIGEDRVRDPLLTPVLEYVFDVSVCIGKMMMSGTFQKFPDVKFIFAHYGGVLPLVKERFDTTYQMLLKRNFVKDLGKLPGEYFKNLYFDTSGSKSPASLSCALELTDPSHILWGSDYPANQNIPSAIDVIHQAKLSDAQKSAIFSQNIQSLLKA